MKKWNSIDHKLTADDIQMEFNEISAHDAFVDGWSAATKKKCASCYLTILRQTGLLQEKTDELTPVKPCPEESAYYIHTGEEWFLEAVSFIRMRLTKSNPICHEENDRRRVV